MDDTRTIVAPAGHPPFADGKDAQALRTIGEVAKAFNLRAHVLRYWEEQFPALQPIKRSGNRRYYRPEDVALIAEIVQLVHRQGYTLRGAANAIAAKPAAGIADGTNPPPIRSAETRDDLFDRLSTIRNDLAKALQGA